MEDFTLGGKQAEDAFRRAFGMVQAEESNPANPPERRKRQPRVSMANQRQRLQVPDLPGYRLYWFKDENIPAAIDAYYEFVKRDEIYTNPIGIGNSHEESGNTDLGTNVSIVAGQNAAGQPVRLHLMKLPLEYYREDQQMIEAKNMSIMEAIFGEEAKMFSRDGSLKEMDGLTYRKEALFNKKKRKVERPTTGNRTLLARLERLEKMAKER
jgi:hypothetical protein